MSGDVHTFTRENSAQLIVSQQFVMREIRIFQTGGIRRAC